MVPFENIAYQPVRIGVIEFINTIPIYFGLQPDEQIEQIPDNPVALNTAMANGKLDISPVSSAHYLQNQDNLILLNDLSVSSYGSVDSVLFMSHKPVNELSKTDTIAVPSDSATSIALLKHILQSETGHNFTAQLVTYPANEFKSAYTKHQTVLIIGDRALSAQQWFKDHHAFCTDLSQWWVNRTNLPFVFAVWVANKQWAKHNSGLLSDINQQLINAKTTFFKSQPLQQAALAKATQLSGLPAEKISHYWHHSLNYDLTDKHHQSLDQFANILKARTMGIPTDTEKHPEQKAFSH